MEEIIWYKNIDWSMVWVCFGGISLIILAMLTGIANRSMYGVENYFKGTWKNYAYQIIAGLVVLSFISEVGLPFLEYFIQIPVDLSNPLDHFLAFISGIGGGFIVAKTIKLFQK